MNQGKPQATDGQGRGNKTTKDTYTCTCIHNLYCMVPAELELPESRLSAVDADTGHWQMTLCCGKIKHMYKLNTTLN